MNIFTLSFFWGGVFTQSLVWINLKVTRTVRGPKGNDWKRDLLIFQPLIIYLLDTCHELTDGGGGIGIGLVWSPLDGDAYSIHCQLLRLETFLLGSGPTSKTARASIPPPHMSSADLDDPLAVT